MICLPTAFFPDAAYLRTLLQNKEVTIDLGEHFIKQTIRNRTIILGANGPLKLIVPLSKWRNNTPVKDIRISYAHEWQKLHWRSVESAYRNSPYFEYYEEGLRKLIAESRFEFLHELNCHVLEFLLKSWKVESELKYIETYQENVPVPDDFRNLNENPDYTPPPSGTYIQVFETAQGFIPNLGAIDLLCNLGPQTVSYLQS